MTLTLCLLFVHFSCQPKNYWTSFNDLSILFNMKPAARALNKVKGDEQNDAPALGEILPSFWPNYSAKNGNLSWLWTASPLWRDKRLVAVLRYEQTRLALVNTNHLAVDRMFWGIQGLILPKSNQICPNLITFSQMSPQFCPKSDHFYPNFAQI